MSEGIQVVDYSLGYEEKLSKKYTWPQEGSAGWQGENPMDSCLANWKNPNAIHKQQNRFVLQRQNT